MTQSLVACLSFSAIRSLALTIWRAFPFGCLKAKQSPNLHQRHPDWVSAWCREFSFPPVDARHVALVAEPLSLTLAAIKRQKARL
jgi:hypothetical protein